MKLINESDNKYILQVKMNRSATYKEAEKITRTRKPMKFMKKPNVAQKIA